MNVPGLRLNSIAPWQCACLLMLFSAPGQAEQFVDPPDQAARLSYVQGSVSVTPAGTQVWGEALLNRPLTSGDALWVDSGGRAEIDIGTVTVRLNENTAFSLASFGNDALQMRLDEGAIVLRVDALDPARPLTVITPGATVAPQEIGQYTIETTPTGAQTLVKVRSGAADVTGAAQLSYGVSANEQGSFSTGPEAAVEIVAIQPTSAFEDWAFGRDVPIAPAVTTQYVAREVVGYRDLDVYGSWRDEPDYGPVWRPTYVSAGWAPYRSGRWLWVAPWGWSWVDTAPWGYAPFHYGRWAYVQQSWCWVPGPRYARPVYAPALVGWVGSPGYNGYGPGSVGWFPLAPREVYRPGYRASWRHFNNVNVSNTVINNTYINNVYYGRGKPTDYRHRHMPHATTVVDRDAFVSARRVESHRRAVKEGDLQAWRGDGRAPTLRPNHDSLVGVRGDPPRRAPHDNRWGSAQAQRDNHATRSDASQGQVRPPTRGGRSEAPPAPVASQPEVTRAWAGQNRRETAPEQPTRRRPASDAVDHRRNALADAPAAGAPSQPAPDAVRRGNRPPQSGINARQPTQPRTQPPAQAQPPTVATRPGIGHPRPTAPRHVAPQPAPRAYAPQPTQQQPHVASRGNPNREQVRSERSTERHAARGSSERAREDAAPPRQAAQPAVAESAPAPARGGFGSRSRGHDRRELPH